jgi:tetratricopeptide (TPR) repeat protein
MLRCLKAASALLVALSVMASGSASAAAEPSRSSTEGHPRRGDSLLTADQAIAELQRRVTDEPTIAYNWVLLGQMYVRKARETGDVANYDRADAALQRALALERDNVAAQATLAQVLCANHRFEEGLELAERVYRAHPEKPQILLLIGDAQLELGRYAAAVQTYDELRRKDPLARLASRAARLAELKGDTDAALRAMTQAMNEESRLALSPEGKAWYPTRLGEMHLHAGHLDEAEHQYEAALRLAPRYYTALSGLGSVRAAQGRYEDAIALYNQAIASSPDVRSLATLGDLYRKIGKDDLAATLFGMIESLATGKTAYDRELALFYCDHARKPEDALALAERDLKTRQDVYAYDTVAWALYQNHRYEDARRAMTEALKLGTRDARLYYHAGMIWAALGERAHAREALQQALAIQPTFDVFGAERARQTLATLA